MYLLTSFLVSFAAGIILVFTVSDVYQVFGLALVFGLAAGGLGSRLQFGPSVTL